MKNTDIEKMLGQVELEPSRTFKKKMLSDAFVASKNSHSSGKMDELFGKRLTPIATALCLVLILVFAGIGLYNENYSEIYVDVNPSIKLVLNRFDIVIDVEYLNVEARDAFDSVSVRGKRSMAALDIIMDALEDEEYLADGVELYVSAYSRKVNVDEKINECVEQLERYKSEHNVSGDVYSHKLTYDEVNHGRKNRISPMKNYIIEQILALSPDLTLDELKESDVGELRDFLDDLLKEPPQNEDINKNESK